MLLSVTQKVCWEVAAHSGKPPLLADPHPGAQARERWLVSEASPTLASPKKESANATAGRANSAGPTASLATLPAGGGSGDRTIGGLGLALFEKEQVAAWRRVA